jgi:hypothetical protein
MSWCGCRREAAALILIDSASLNHTLAPMGRAPCNFGTPYFNSTLWYHLLSWTRLSMFCVCDFRQVACAVSGSIFAGATPTLASISHFSTQEHRRRSFGHSIPSLSWHWSDVIPNTAISWLWKSFLRHSRAGRSSILGRKHMYPSSLSFFVFLLLLFLLFSLLKSRAVAHTFWCW